MQPLDLNLASRPFRNNALLWAGYGLAAVLLLAFTAWNVRAYVREGRDLEGLRAKVGGIDRRLGELDIREKRARMGIDRQDVKYLAVQAKTANAVIRRKALSWTRLFNLLETVVPYEVKMVAVRPVYARQERGAGAQDSAPEGSVPVGLEGTAQSLEAFFELERNLMADPHFDRVEPERSSLTQGNEVVFELRCLYFQEGRTGGGPPVELPHVLAAAAEEPPPPGWEKEVGADAGAAPAQPVPPAPARVQRGPEPPRAAPPAAPPPAVGRINAAPTPEEIEKAKRWKPRLADESAQKAGATGDKKKER